MPVRRFRSVEEMPAPPIHPRGSEELFRAISETWAAARSLAPLHFPPGVYRHRTIEELNAQTDAWSRQNIRLFAQRRRPAGAGPKS